METLLTGEGLPLSQNDQQIDDKRMTTKARSKGVWVVPEAPRVDPPADGRPGASFTADHPAGIGLMSPPSLF